MANTDFDDRRRSPDLWHLNGVSDQVVRTVMAARAQLQREMPLSANERDAMIAHLFVAHELLAQVWKPITKAAGRETSLRVAEALADISQVLVDLTSRSEKELSGQRELERRRQKKALEDSLRANPQSNMRGRDRPRWGR